MRCCLQKIKSSSQFQGEDSFISNIQSLFGNDIIFDATDHTPSSTGFAIYQHKTGRFVSNYDSRASPPRFIGKASLGIASFVDADDGDGGGYDDTHKDGVESSACSSPWHGGGEVGGAAAGREDTSGELSPSGKSWSLYSESWSPEDKNFINVNSVFEPAASSRIIPEYGASDDRESWTSEYGSDGGKSKTSVMKKASTCNETDGDGGAKDDCRDGGAQSNAQTRADPCKAAADSRGGRRSRQGDGGARKAAAVGGAGCSRRAGSNQHGDGDGGTATGRGPGQGYKDKIGGGPSPFKVMNTLDNMA